MFRKILLLICVAFVVVCYAYPCFVLPLGTYNGEIGNGENVVEVSLKFDFNGKVKIKMAESESEQNYKLSGNYVIISEDEAFDDKDLKIKLNSIYNFAMNEGIVDINMQNDIGMYMAIGIGAFAIILILLPNRRK